MIYPVGENMTTEKEMDEKTGDIEKRETMGYSMISIRMDIRERMNNLNLKTPRGARMPYGQIIEFLIDRYVESTTIGLESKLEKHTYTSWDTKTEISDWEVSPDRTKLFRYKVNGQTRSVYRSMTIPRDMRNDSDQRIIDILTTPVWTG